MSHKKFGPDRFSRFDVYWIQTDRQTDKQTDKPNLYIDVKTRGRYTNNSKLLFCSCILKHTLYIRTYTNAFIDIEICRIIHRKCRNNKHMKVSKNVEINILFLSQEPKQCLKTNDGKFVYFAQFKLVLKCLFSVFFQELMTFASSSMDYRLGRA